MTAPLTQRKLTEVKLNGERAFHVFVDPSGGTLKVPCTMGDYTKMGAAGGTKHNPIAPDGYRWSHSQSEYNYDTADGDLPDNTYCDLGNGRVMVKVPESEAHQNIPRSD